MLKLMLLAILVIGCKCHEEYDLNSNSEFVYLKGRKVFPSFTTERENLFFEFVVQAAPAENALVFDAKLGKGEATFRFDKGGLYFNLLSLHLKFPEGHQRRLEMLFHSVGTNEIWIVVSRVFTPPTTDSCEIDADKNAVYANNDLTIHEALALQDQLHMEVKKVSFSVQWIEELFKKDPPKFHVSRQSNSATKFYRSLPVILGNEALDTFNDVRTAIMGDVVNENWVEMEE